MTHTHRPIVRIVGLGNIGFRHLQGLSPMAGDINIEGFDVDAGAIERARAEWDSIPSAYGRFLRPEHISGPADLTVLATSAVGREALLAQHLEIGSRQFVLEKVVFTDTDTFTRVQQDLEARGAVACVNTARRLWPLYRTITAIVEAANAPLTLEVVSRHLGLACNGVHFIDLLQMLSGHSDVTTVMADISAPWASKRPGYYEVWGDVKFEAGASRLVLSVQPDGPEATHIRLRVGDTQYILDETSGIVTTTGGSDVVQAGRAPYQSELSIEYARPILRGAESALPSLSDSGKAHKALFDAIRPAFEKAGLMNDQQIPIT
ncbi:MAG: hypothetical protein ACK4NU_00830 [Brevundimonas sp.]